MWVRLGVMSVASLRLSDPCAFFPGLNQQSILCGKIPHQTRALVRLSAAESRHILSRLEHSTVTNVIPWVEQQIKRIGKCMEGGFKPTKQVELQKTLPGLKWGPSEAAN